ncbi:MAG: VRR-NUC domain-containing protein [Deltaproteobacteria bacterium]|nr:VRR-NUC domain-containing protein [Deltaproteobacteria bacterium]
MRKFKLKPYVPSEMSEQRLVVEWARLLEWKYPELKLLHSTLNGVRLPIGLAVKAKRAGNKSGCPDLYLDVARGGFFGLRLEMKRRANARLSAEQEWWLDALREQGYRCEVPRGADDAIGIIAEYLALPPTVRGNMRSQTGDILAARFRKTFLREHCMRVTVNSGGRFTAKWRLIADEPFDTAKFRHNRKRKTNMYLTEAQQLAVIRALNLDKLPEAERTRILEEVGESECERDELNREMYEAEARKQEEAEAEYERLMAEAFQEQIEVYENDQQIKQRV